MKIDPKSIGVGQYQHDMNQKKLGEALGGVVEDCVNRVGVDLNTASAPLLEYISGVSKAVAKNIVDYREENGRFTNRRQLLKVPKLGPKAFEQCAGFLRISDGDNPLDATSVHPESYPATMELLEKLELSMEDVRALQAESRKAAHGSASGSGKAGDTGALENQKKAGRNDRRKGGFPDPQHEYRDGTGAGGSAQRYGHGRAGENRSRSETKKRRSSRAAVF